MDILVKLFRNPGLFHVAENVIGFMDNSTVAKCRLVSKESNDFLANILLMRCKEEALKLCEKKLQTTERGSYGKLIYSYRSIFELWPDWKVALDDFESIEQFGVVIFLLQKCFAYYDIMMCYPLHFAATHSGHQNTSVEEAEKWRKVFEILISTSLDFNTCDERNNTVLHKACEKGSKEVVEIILDNAAKKEIDVNAVNGFNETILQCTMRNDRKWPKKLVFEHLFEQRNEFDFDIKPVDVRGNSILHIELVFKWAIEQGINLNQVDDRGDSILHFACEYTAPIALFLLLESGTYEFDRSVLSSLANLRNGENKRPIDLARESVYHEFPLGIRVKLIKELEKYTSDIE